MKQCFKCLRTLPLEEFYRHPKMEDGRLNKCKECAKVDVRARYALTRDAKAAYDRKRDRTPERRRQRAETLKRHHKRHPERAKARRAVAYAIRTGKLKRLPCQVCNDPEVQAHHPDYSRPLHVVWLCFRCHRETAHQQKLRTS